MDADDRCISCLDASRRDDSRFGVSVDVCDHRSLLSKHDLDRLTALCHAAMRESNLSGEVRIKLVSDSEMIDAHTRYSDDPTTTDVLTFDLSDGPGPRTLDVDLLLCVDEARRQATTRGHPVERELVLYALHGMLHCVGYDDHDDADFAAMHAEEDRVLEAIGVGRTFAAGEKGGTKA